MEQNCFVMVLYDLIINIYLNIAANLVCKQFVHQAMVSCPDVLETVWNFTVAKAATIGMKGRFLLIFSFHLDLMIALVCIEKTLELESI